MPNWLGNDSKMLRNWSENNPNGLTEISFYFPQGVAFSEALGFQDIPGLSISRIGKVTMVL